MGLSASDEELVLSGVPEGLVARPLRRFRHGEGGEAVEVRTRRRLRKLERVELVAPGTVVDAQLPPGEERWLLETEQRRWTGIVSRYGDEAWTRATELARAGVVRMRCGVDEQMALGSPEGWALTDTWKARRADAGRARELERQEWRERTWAAARAVRDRAPELAEALEAAAPGSPTTQVLVFAAEDLLAGVIHAGPRAFSQAHFEDTKARDDVARVLTDAGVPETVLLELGLTRSARLGVAGPVAAAVNGVEVALNSLDGPVLLRASQPGLVLRLRSAAVVVIVENLQAAEVLADHLPRLAVIYTAGVPSEPALRLVRDLAAEAEQVLVVPDADLGGVRIAEALLAVAPRAELVDVGDREHPVRKPGPPDGATTRDLRKALHGPAQALAAACLARGYPVEQELATLAAVRAALG